MKNSAGKMIAGFFVGAAVGAVAGILFAPDKGSVTRKKISDQASETGGAVKETISGKLDDLKKYVTSKLENVHSKIEEFEDTVKEMENAEPDTTPKE